MTEEEWLTCEDSSKALEGLAKIVGARKTRLALCGCLRTPAIWSHLTSPISRHAVEVGEAFADGGTTLEELGRTRKRANAVAGRGWGKGNTSPPAAYLANHVCLQNYNLLAFLYLASNYLRQLRPQTTLLRDVFGNPFRPVVFSAEWRTSTAVALARQMYESRDFSAMPILADALQDAGCESDDILNHCRDEKQTHVRGCWVVDLVLGKS